MDENEQTNDFAWLGELTSIDTEPQQNQAPAQQMQAAEQQQEPEQELPKIDYSSFDNIDEDTARELDERLLSPLSNRMKALEEENKRMRDARAADTNQERLNNIERVNSALFNKYSRDAVERISKSADFRRYVNRNDSKYSNGSGFDAFTRAYYAGDEDYVMREFDSFVEAKNGGKPVPQGVSPSYGSVPQRANREEKPQMTEADFVRKRRSLIGRGRNAPVGKLRENADKLIAAVNAQYGVA